MIDCINPDGIISWTLYVKYISDDNIIEKEIESREGFYTVRETIDDMFNHVQNLKI